MITAVIFDIGNVLIKWQPEAYYDRVIGPKRRKQMFAQVDLHSMNERVDQGGPFKDTIYKTADAYPHWANEIRMWHDNWLELAQPVIEYSVRLLHALHTNGVPVFALTNFGIESFALAERHFDFLNAFDRRYISGHMGVTKPNPKIYQMVEQDCAITPKQLLFVDDRADNIAAAQARGWNTHHFITASR